MDENMDPVLFFGIFKKIVRDKRMANDKSDVLVASIRGRKQLINKEDIWFAESIGRKVNLYLNDRSVEVYFRMSDLMGQLGSGFFQTHRSYIVNLDHIIGYERNEIMLSNKVRVPMSRHKYRDFLKAYLR